MTESINLGGGGDSTVKSKKKKEKEKEKEAKEKAKKQLLEIKKPVSIAEKLFKLSNQLLAKLAPSELFRLSELQLQLENSRTEFQVVYTVANSQFLQVLAKERLALVMEENKKLFELIKMEEMKSKQN